MWHRSALYLLLLGSCLLACTGVPVPGASPLPPPGFTPTSTPTPDEGVTDITYAERPAWRALLGWPEECEELYGRFTRQPQDDGGVTVYPVADRQFLVFVTCNLGPYWVEARVYWLDRRTSPPTAHSLTVPELIQDDAPARGLHAVDVLHGAFPSYDPATQTLTNLHAYRGPKDCGVFYRYHLEDARFVLDEVRAHACDDAAAPIFYDEWPLVYPLTTTAHADPFRQVVPVPADLQGQITRLEALPNGDLRLLTTAGYALFHAGAWQPYFLAPSQHFIGVDGAGRLWFFPEESPATIFYWDSASAGQGGSTYVRADAGWLPPADPDALERRGVLTDGQGQVWLATEEDVRVFADDRWTIFTRATLGMPPASDADLLTEFTLAYSEERQQIWVGVCDWSEGPTGGGGARWLDTAAFAAGNVAWRGAQSPVGGGCVTAIAPDGAGRVWIGMASRPGAAVRPDDAGVARNAAAGVGGVSPGLSARLPVRQRRRAVGFVGLVRGGKLRRNAYAPPPPGRCVARSPWSTRRFSGFPPHGCVAAHPVRRRRDALGFSQRVGVPHRRQSPGAAAGRHPRRVGRHGGCSRTSLGDCAKRRRATGALGFGVGRANGEEDPQGFCCRAAGAKTPSFSEKLGVQLAAHLGPCDSC